MARRRQSIYYCCCVEHLNARCSSRARVAFANDMRVWKCQAVHMPALTCVLEFFCQRVVPCAHALCSCSSAYFACTRERAWSCCRPPLGRAEARSSVGGTRAEAAGVVNADASWSGETRSCRLTAVLHVLKPDLANDWHRVCVCQCAGLLYIR